MNSKRTISIVATLLVLIAILTAILVFAAPKFNELYEKKLQTPLFTGFLTLGSFLLTLKIFIVVQLKEKLYDSEFYMARAAKLRLQNEKLQLYAPLARLAELLLIAVISAIGTAILQITLGFVDSQIAAAICFSCAIGTLGLVIFTWWQIRHNIHDLFEIVGKGKDAEIDKQAAELLHKSRNAD